MKLPPHPCRHVSESSAAPACGQRLGKPNFSAHPDLDAAITRSQSYLLSEQKPEGYWVGELMVDVTLVADMVAFYHWWGKVDPVWQRKAVHHIFEKQLPDGDGTSIPTAQRR